MRVLNPNEPPGEESASHITKLTWPSNPEIGGAATAGTVVESRAPAPPWPLLMPPGTMLYPSMPTWPVMTVPTPGVMYSSGYGQAIRPPVPYPQPLLHPAYWFSSPVPPMMPPHNQSSHNQSSHNPPRADDDNDAKDHFATHLLQQQQEEQQQQQQQQQEQQKRKQR